MFDDSRNPFDRVEGTDWHPAPAEFKDLDVADTLEKRRRWYLELRDRGMV